MTDATLQPPAHPIELETPLWRFAVSLWQEAEAADAALALQSAGWAVSHLLVAAYLAREGYLWDGQEPSGIRRWREGFTQQLRRLRTALPKTRSDLSPLRTGIAQAELEAERIELGYWFQWLQTHPLPRTPAHPPARLLAENLVAIGGEFFPRNLSMLSDFAQALIPSAGHDSFLADLQAVLSQSDLQP